MASEATLGGFTLKRRQSPSSPTLYTAVPEVFSISGIGQTNDLVDVTNFDSAGNREYIGGLADGQEVTIEANYVPEHASFAQQSGLISDVTSKLTVDFQLLHTATSPNVLFSFSLAMLSYVINPSVDNRNTITFTGKISGSVTIA
jgi:hypothetical protein